jgi:hypothetical protein
VAAHCRSLKPTLPLLPAFFEDGRAQVGHPRGVRVRFRSDVEPALARAFDHLQAHRRLAQAGAGDVDDVQRRARSGRIGQHFLQRIDGAGLHWSAVAHVDIHRDFALGSQAENIQNLRPRLLHVRDPHADAERAVAQSAPQQAEHFAMLAVRRHARGGRIARQERAAIVQFGHQRRNMPHGGAEVDERMAFAFRVPRHDGPRAHLHFERCGHAVARLEGVVLGIDAMLVQVNEAGRYHQPLHVHHFAAGQRCRRNRGDLAASDADETHRVQVRRRFHHPAVGQHHVVLLGCQWQGRQHEEKSPHLTV